MHVLGGILLGLINVAIVVAILILVGLIILLIFQHLLNIAIDQRIQKLYMVIVALIAIYMIVALLLGLAVPFRVLFYDPLLIGYG